MNKRIRFLIIGLIGLNLLFCSWYVIHGDIYFFTDVARDFFLFGEISTKKIMLIGPRTSTAGLFHGPLWAYLNFPAYLIGDGNPVVVGWYWIGLIIAFLIGSFYIAKNLFSEKTAYLYALLLSQLMIFHSRGLFNPHGALFVIPLFFYFFVRYEETKKNKFLLLHLVAAGVVIQFQMAIGVPLLFLSTLYILPSIIRTKKFIHILSYPVLILPLSTFVVFDLRNNFLQLRAATAFASPESRENFFDYFSQIPDRANLLIRGLQVNNLDFTTSWTVSLILFVTVCVLIYLKLKEKKQKTVYIAFSYFYIGFVLLSFLNKGPILYHQFFPLLSLTTLIFVSLLDLKVSKKLIVIFVFTYLYNFVAVVNHINASKSFIGNSFESWKFLTTVANKIFDSSDKSFGYFVYAPDTVAYGPKYAMSYFSRISSKESYNFQKKEVTYLLIEPPPANDQYIKDEWWKENKLHLSRKPENTISFPNGYKIERYELSADEIAIPPEPDIDPGLHFR